MTEIDQLGLDSVDLADPAFWDEGQMVDRKTDGFTVKRMLAAS